MPSFDIVSEVDKQEIDNALNQARKELATRFDFKGTVAEIEQEKDKIILTAEDASRLRGLREIPNASQHRHPFAGHDRPTSERTNAASVFHDQLLLVPPNEAGDLQNASLG